MSQNQKNGTSSDLFGEITKLKAEIDELKLKNYNKNQYLSKLEKQNKDLESENLSIKRKFSALERDLNNAKTEVSRLRLR